MIRTVCPAPYSFAKCDACGAESDRYGTTATVIRCESTSGWRFRRAWPFWWRWTAKCPQCASTMRTIHAAVDGRITAAEAARRLELA